VGIVDVSPLRAVVGTISQEFGGEHPEEEHRNGSPTALIGRVAEQAAIWRLHRPCRIVCIFSLRATPTTDVTKLVQRGHRPSARIPFATTRKIIEDGRSSRSSPTSACSGGDSDRHDVSAKSARNISSIARLTPPFDGGGLKTSPGDEHGRSRQPDDHVERRQSAGELGGSASASSFGTGIALLPESTLSF
jgi:hypothetical protein